MSRWGGGAEEGRSQAQWWRARDNGFGNRCWKAEASIILHIIDNWALHQWVWFGVDAALVIGPDQLALNPQSHTIIIFFFRPVKWGLFGSLVGLWLNPIERCDLRLNESNEKWPRMSVEWINICGNSKRLLRRKSKALTTCFLSPKHVQFHY